MEQVKLGNLKVSRLIIGGNPFSGFSHQSPEMDMRMQRYYTTARIKETLREGENLGITAATLRVDRHICRLMLEYGDEGGALQWIAQGQASADSVEKARLYGAKAYYIHGGVMDHLLANGRQDEVQPVLDGAREMGMPAGVAGHDPGVFRWAEQNLRADFYMCSYYNPTSRRNRPEHKHGAKEHFDDGDREIMTDLIRQLSRPVVHYKVMAAGRNDAEKALAYVAGAMRPCDAVCIGVYTRDKPQMLSEDAELLECYLSRSGQ